MAILVVLCMVFAFLHGLWIRHAGMLSVYGEQAASFVMYENISRAFVLWGFVILVSLRVTIPLFL